MKKELLDILEKIQIKTGLSQGEISEKAGYSANYISEAISKNQISKKLVRTLKGLLDTEKKGISVEDAGAMIINNQVELIATNRVALSILAEVQAPLAKRLPTELLNIYRRMVKDEVEQVRKELKI